MPIKGEAFTCTYLAWDTSSNVGKTGDAANHSIQFIKNGIAITPTTAPLEVQSDLAPGIYSIAVTGDDSLVDTFRLAGESSSANVNIHGQEYTMEQGTLKTILTSTDLNSIVDGSITWGQLQIALLSMAAGKHEIQSDGDTNRYRQDGTIIAVGFDKSSQNLFTPATVNLS